jgi:hypothetical protein
LQRRQKYFLKSWRVTPLKNAILDLESEKRELTRKARCEARLFFFAPSLGGRIFATPTVREELGLGITKAKSKAKSRGKKPTGSAMGSGKQVDMDGLRRKITNLVGGKALLMVKTSTDEAVKVGDLSAMKYLFELIGLHPASPNAAEPTESDDGNDITAALLAELGISTKSEEERADEGEVAASVGSDSVE